MLGRIDKLVRKNVSEREYGRTVILDGGTFDSIVFDGIVSWPPANGALSDILREMKNEEVIDVHRGVDSCRMILLSIVDSAGSGSLEDAAISL